MCGVVQVYGVVMGVWSSQRCMVYLTVCGVVRSVWCSQECVVNGWCSQGVWCSHSSRYGLWKQKFHLLQIGMDGPFLVDIFVDIAAVSEKSLHLSWYIEEAY